EFQRPAADFRAEDGAGVAARQFDSLLIAVIFDELCMGRFRAAMRRNGGFRECVAHVRAVAVAKTLPLDHQHKDEAPLWIDPALRAPGAAVAERAGRMQPRHTLRLIDDAPAQSPAVAGRKAGNDARRLDS